LRQGDGRLNCYRTRTLGHKTKRALPVSIVCAFEKGVDGLKRDLEAIVEREFVGYGFPRILGQSPLVDLI
jgi:hypothetical protein